MPEKPNTRRINRLVVSLMGLVLLLSVTIAVGFYWISSHDLGRYIRSTLFPNLQQHVIYVVRDVRENRHSAYIRELANRLNMDIALSDADGFWSTSVDLDASVLARVDRTIDRRSRRSQGKDSYRKHSNWFFDDDDDDDDGLERIPWFNLAQRQADLRQGRFFSISVKGNPGIVYREPGLEMLLVYRETLLPLTEINYLKLLAWLLLIMLISFFVIYRILRPLKDLRKGVDAIEQGRYDKVIPQRSKNELGRLVQSFNKMATSVSEQIQRKEQLLYDMSHELRSPLARMKVALEFVPNSNARDMIADDIREQETIIEELLENARLKNQQMQLNCRNIDLVELIAATIRKRRLKRIHFDCQEDRVEVFADAQRIVRVLHNLLDNAIKYSPARSPITVTLQRQDAYVRVSVIDKGPGIREEDKERIFEPFYRLDSSRTRTTGGYGLGLSLCRHIIDAHQGHIFADTGNKGLRVVFTLPATVGFNSSIA